MGRFCLLVELQRWRVCYQRATGYSFCEAARISMYLYYVFIVCVVICVAVIFCVQLYCFCVALVVCVALLFSV